MRILYWDDSEAVLENVTKKLEKLCHKAVPARTIEECKAALADTENPIDLFIADHTIDEENGMNFIMGAKGMDPELHVVVLAPSILRSEYNQLQMCGIEVLKKPILLDQVVRPFLAPDKRRKKTTPPPMPVQSPERKGVGLLGIEEPNPSDAAAENDPPKKRKGLTRLFSRD